MAGDFTRADVERLARLARLELTEHEKDLLTTAGVPPTSHPLATVGAWRDDVPQPSIDRRDAVAQAPEADLERGLFKVPRVLA